MIPRWVYRLQDFDLARVYKYLCALKDFQSLLDILITWCILTGNQTCIMKVDLHDSQGINVHLLIVNTYPVNNCLGVNLS